MKFEITRPEIHPKAWGSEKWLINNDKFCGKILYINKGAKFSGHFHDLKEEIQFCYKGALILRYIDKNNGKLLENNINVGDIINIPRLQVHQLEALENSEIFEVSTTHWESDSYRVFPGDSQNK
jgi:quercetin dioxygenase-like cupin family protein